MSRVASVCRSLGVIMGLGSFLSGAFARDRPVARLAKSLIARRFSGKAWEAGAHPRQFLPLAIALLPCWSMILSENRFPLFGTMLLKPHLPRDDRAVKPAVE